MKIDYFPAVTRNLRISPRFAKFVFNIERRTVRQRKAFGRRPQVATRKQPTPNLLPATSFSLFIVVFIIFSCYFRRPLAFLRQSI